MSIIIAGSAVAINDQLYSRRASAWGRVTQVLDNAVVLSITKSGASRNYTVTAGGMVAGIRDAYWHEPLDLDLGKANIGKAPKIQAIVNAVAGVL